MVLSHGRQVKVAKLTFTSIPTCTRLRPIPVARHFRFASIKRPVKLRREYASEYDMPGSVQSERTRFTAALHDAATIDYVYDFGDNWHHRIKLQKTLPSEAQ